MSELLPNDDHYRRRAQSLYEYRPRVNTELAVVLLTKLVSSQNSPLPAVGNVIPIIEPIEVTPDRRRRTLFFIFEPIVASLIIFPLLVIFWQSGWNLMVEWLETSRGQHCGILLSFYFLSQLLFLLIYVNQDRLYDFLVKQEFKFVSHIILQCHSFIVASNYIVQWVSIWTLLDRYTSSDWLLMLLISIAAIFATIALTGHPCDLVCAPFVISYDSIESNVRIGSSFVTEKMRQCYAHILNYILYEHVLSLFSILAWRGLYTLLDIHLYPSDENMSVGVSLLIGYASYFILMYTQGFENRAFPLFSTFMSLNYPFFLANLRHLCAFFSCVLLWRGFWILFDAHIATISLAYQLPYIFYVICMIASFLILSLMKTASSINGPMSQMEDEYNLFPVYPNCFLVKWFKTKKTANELPTNLTKTADTKPVVITHF